MSKPLFLVEDAARHRWYVLRPEHQFLPRDVSVFKGEDIRVSWGAKSFIRGVIEPGTRLVVEKIEYVMGPTMSYDVIHAKLLTSSHAGRCVRVQDLFRPSDRPSSPIRPREECLKEGLEDG